MVVPSRGRLAGHDGLVVVGATLGERSLRADGRPPLLLLLLLLLLGLVVLRLLCQADLGRESTTENRVDVSEILEQHRPVDGRDTLEKAIIRRVGAARRPRTERRRQGGTWLLGLKAQAGQNWRFHLRLLFILGRNRGNERFGMRAQIFTNFATHRPSQSSLWDSIRARAQVNAAQRCMADNAVPGCGAPALPPPVLTVGMELHLPAGSAGPAGVRSVRG
eukprot:g47168.t1